MDNLKIIARLDGTQTTEQLKAAAVTFDNCGADALYYYDSSSFDGDKDAGVRAVRAVCGAVGIPVYVCSKITRFEDIKKLVYAGAETILIPSEDGENRDAVKEAAGRFGSERLYLYLASRGPKESLELAKKALDDGFGGICLVGEDTGMLYAQTADYLKANLKVPVLVSADTMDPAEVGQQLKLTMPAGIILPPDDETVDFMALKQQLKSESLPVNTFESALSFDEFKLNSDGMIPVITQEYKTGEVLMLAYMTKEAFEKTVATGKMTYFSRSRQELWTKGETSGHFQYVKSLTIDCDNDTLLAKVAQIGPACHTGHHSCFFTDLLRKEEEDKTNPLAVFETVFDTITDRREHPKEGSYTNYLFDKGLDKILKKFGEEITEVVIASKNPDDEEFTYEICDLLYHLMVLMAERGLTWKEVTDALAKRH